MEASAYLTPYPDVNAVLHALLSDVQAIRRLPCPP